MQRVALINWENINQDYDLLKIFQALATSWVAEWLEVQNGIVTPWFAFINIVRDGITFPVLFHNTSSLNIDTTWTKKVFIELDQVKIDDGSENNSNGTWIWEIKTWSDYPSTNFLKLASIDSWNISDERDFITTKEYLNITKMWNVFNWANQLIKTDSQWKIPVLDGSNITWIKAEVNSSSLKYMLWSEWIVWKAYSVIDYAQINWQNTHWMWQLGQQIIAQSFFWQKTPITNIILFLSKFNTPSDTVFIEIRSDNAWNPWLQVLATSESISYDNISTSASEKEFTFLTPVALEPFQKYWINVKRSWWNDNINYYWVWFFNASTFTWETKKWNWTSWISDSWNIYFKISWYKLAIKWWDNFVWICQQTWNIWEESIFNQFYDWNQLTLVTWNYYWYDSNWNLIWGYDFRAISETEILFDSSTMWTDKFFWNWSNWDLIITSWTYNLAVWEYNYSNVIIKEWATLNITWTWTTLIKVNNLFENNGTLKADWIWNTWSFTLPNWTVLYPWSPGKWWNWWAGWNASINWIAYWWAGWTWSTSWYGWGGWGWASDSYWWGAWWTWWFPGWLWWAGRWWWAGWNAYWNAWQWANWNWWSFAPQSWWLSGWWWWSKSNWAWAGWWAWWVKWWDWWIVVIYANKVWWSWIVSLKWLNWWVWWNWGAWNSDSSWPGWWGGGWGGWGWGWLSVIVYNSDYSWYNYQLTAWTWWAWWTAWSFWWSVAWTVWDPWSIWKQYKISFNSI